VYVLCCTPDVGVCVILYCTLGVGLCVVFRCRHMYCDVLYTGCRCMCHMSVWVCLLHDVVFCVWNMCCDVHYVYVYVIEEKKGTGCFPGVATDLIWVKKNKGRSKDR